MFTLGELSEYKKYKRGQTINTKTYIKGGFLGLGLKRGANLRVKSTGNHQKDAIKVTRAFYNREKKAGRM